MHKPACTGSLSVAEMVSQWPGLMVLSAGETADDQSSVAGQGQAENDQTVSSPLHPSVNPGQLHPPPLHPPLQPKADFTGRKAKQKGKGATSDKASALQQLDKEHRPIDQGLEHESDLVSPDQGPPAGADDNQQEVEDDFVSNASQVSSQDPRAVTKQGQKGSRGGAPKTPGGAVRKPTRCQKCYTCLHKQLKKQCLRNKVSMLVIYQVHQKHA